MGTPGSPTLKELRRATADKVAPFELVHTGVEQADGAGGTTWVGTDRSNSRRRIVSTELASLSADGQFAENPRDYLKNEWVLLCTSPVQQRRLPSLGYVGDGTIETVVAGYDPALVVGSPTDPCGYLDLERPFSSLVQPGLECEIHAVPPLRGGKSAGLHAAIAHALRVRLRDDTIDVAGVVGQNVIDVTALFPWLTMPGQFIDATYPEQQAGVELYRIPGASLRFDADRVLLSPAISTASPIPVRVKRPISTWICPAATGVWGESTVGLVEDDDRCLGDLDELALLAAFHVADSESRQCIVGSPEQQFWTLQANAFSQRLPSLKDQRTRRARSGAYPWPDLVSVDGPLGGRWGPGWR